MKDDVIWVRSNGKDKWQKPLAPTEQPVKARVNLTARLVRSSAGDEVVAQGPILFPQEPTFDDRIRIKSVDRTVIAFKPGRSFGKATHWEVFVA